MTSNAYDPDLLRADIEFPVRLCEHDLRFKTTWGLFSPRNIDEGSRLLLDHLRPSANARILDLGCGYGALGITLSKMCPKGQVCMLDKDFVAVEYSNKNIALNQTKNCEARLSNGFSHAPEGPFDLIVSNIPAKVGNELLTLFTLDAFSLLAPGGQYCVVTINGLRQFMKRNFTEVFGNAKKVKQGKSYTITTTQKPF